MIRCKYSDINLDMTGKAQGVPFQGGVSGGTSNGIIMTGDMNNQAEDEVGSNGCDSDTKTMN